MVAAVVAVVLRAVAVGLVVAGVVPQESATEETRFRIAVAVAVVRAS